MNGKVHRTTRRQVLMSDGICLLCYKQHRNRVVVTGAEAAISLCPHLYSVNSVS